MKTQHTPGPWKVINQYVTTNKDPHGELVICVTSNWHTQVSFAAQCASFEDAANARLIAAAPELLETLKAIVRAFDSDPFGRIGVAIVNDARAAITKAKGE